jgi:hypothetical protein
MSPLNSRLDQTRRWRKDPIPEGLRRALASVIQWGGWLGTLGLFLWATFKYDPTEGRFAPQWVGFAFIFLIGLAIAGTTARSRMRLTDAIIHAFRTGMLTASSSRSGVQQGLEDEKKTSA